MASFTGDSDCPSAGIVGATPCWRSHCSSSEQLRSHSRMLSGSESGLNVPSSLQPKMGVHASSALTMTKPSPLPMLNTWYAVALSFTACSCCRAGAWCRAPAWRCVRNCRAMMAASSALIGVPLTVTAVNRHSRAMMSLFIVFKFWLQRYKESDITQSENAVFFALCPT